MTALHFCARFRHIAAGAALVTAATAPRAEAQQETLAAVLDRAGRYVVEFHRQLSGIVAEEHYVQEVRPPARRSGNFLSMGLPRAAHRELTSDFLLVRLVGAEQYVEFRDVFEVDGKPVRELVNGRVGELVTW